MGDLKLKTSQSQSVDGETPPKATIDLVLVEASQAGDDQAFGQLYDIWADKVYRFVYLKIRHKAVAEDITADVFLKAWQHIHQYRPRAGQPFSAWLYTIARNTLIDYYRSQKHVEVSFEDMPEIADLEGPDLYQEASHLETLLTKLPSDYEKVLRLRFIEGLPIAKVAQIMKKKEDNIRALSSRALKKLAEDLEGTLNPNN